MILIERSQVVELHRDLVNMHLDAQRPQRRHILRVEIGHRAREQPHAMLDALAAVKQQLVSHQVELHRERAVVPGNGRRAEPARRHVERHVPPVIFERRQRHAGLAHDLRPHVQRVAGVLPLGKGKRGPLRRIQA